MNTLMFHGHQLMDQDGKMHSHSILENSILFLYFAAQWCPDCQSFTPILLQAFQDYQKNWISIKKKKSIQILFIGSDSTQEDQLSHFQMYQGKWLMIPYEDEIRNELKRKYQICAAKEQKSLGIIKRKHGIPTLMVVDETGKIIHDDLTKEIIAQGWRVFENFNPCQTENK